MLIPNWKWIDTQEEITSLTQFNEDIIGFVYLIEYTTGKFYIGKKNLYQQRTIPSKKSGQARPNSYQKNKLVLNKKTNKKERKSFDVIISESDWLKYTGSHSKQDVIQNRFILSVATSKIGLTYTEAAMLFKYDVLRNNDCLNDNILNKFYRGKV